ncbi:type II toxin-antitoxin system VapC family toxin [Rubrobacter tropicus]|uniref:type II toxin-antitoxin system VapC family toxin n=1 Tax=Rubrobacter tropicus TaxID=2653851 RepID=UPI001D193CEC|nr:type II toxin-antitoxin system VapC family toxin [Rubrobacter tropicus]
MLDASAAATVLLNRGADASRIRERMGRAGDDLHAPHLFEVEVASVLRRYALNGSLSPGRARLALGRLATLSISLYPHTALLPRVWELRDNISAYDAAYIALAETLEAPLVTRDAKLARAPGIRAEVEVFG